MLARMSNFTKGHCNVFLPGGARCPCTTGRCAFDFTGAGDVESLKCHTCSHRMWDHNDSLGADDDDLERGIGVGIGIGDPPPYDEGSRRNDTTQQQQQHQFMTATRTTTIGTGALELPTQPAQSHNHYYTSRSTEPVRYDAPLATTYSFPARDTNTNLPQYNIVRQVPLSRPSPRGRTCTANLLIGVILGFVIVATPFIAYRIVTS